MTTNVTPEAQLKRYIHVNLVSLANAIYSNDIEMEALDSISLKLNDIYGIIHPEVNTEDSESEDEQFVQLEINFEKES